MTAIRRCDPVFSGLLIGRRRKSTPPLTLMRSSIRPSVSRAFSHAFSSVGAMIGRNATWIFGLAGRPAARAAACRR